MITRSTYIQIRVTPREKRTLKRLARATGGDLSGYVLSRALPANKLRFEELLRALAQDDDHRYALAELNDLLSSLSAVELPDAIEHADVSALQPLLRNYVAAMVEHAAHRAGVGPPGWVRAVAPLDEPYFAAPLTSLRLHLLRASPVAFRRRNLFVDATLGARV